jgi:hypothetical protein
MKAPPIAMGVMREAPFSSTLVDDRYCTARYRVISPALRHNSFFDTHNGDFDVASDALRQGSLNVGAQLRGYSPNIAEVGSLAINALEKMVYSSDAISSASWSL